MINPIIIIITAALLLSVLVICIINRPKKPIITGTLIFILVCFVITTWMLDNVISSPNSSSQFAGFINFVILNDNPTDVQLEQSFNIFMIMDMILFCFVVISLIFEALYILKSDRGK